MKLPRAARRGKGWRDVIGHTSRLRPCGIDHPVPNQYTLTFSSELNASVASVWDVVGTMQGVNAELAPCLKMTAPGEAANLRIEDAPIGQPLFASWALFVGVLPTDRHASTSPRSSADAASSRSRRRGASAAGSTAATLNPMANTSASSRTG